MIFRKQSTSGNIIKECSSTEVAAEYLRQITEDNFMEAFNLKLANGQKRFVSHPIRSLAQAYVYRNQCQPFGIYKDDTMIGYVMVIEYIKTKPFGASDKVTLTCNIDNIHALNLYKNKGFKETGAMDEDEIELSLIL